VIRGGWPLAAAAVFAVLAGLVSLGRVAAPSWDPPPLTAGLAYPALPPLPVDEARSGPPGGAAGGAAAVGFRREDTSFAVAGQRLRAAVFSPQRPGRHPAVAFVHGAGTGTLEDFADQAQFLAGRGVVVLTYDKRSAGYSPWHRDYAQLAADAVAAAGMLRGRADVDPDRVGLWGTSEGGWVVPLAAGADPRLAFAILMNAPAMSPLAQTTWSLDAAMRRQGVPGSARRAAVRAFNLGDAGYVRHDPEPVLRAVRQPVLILQGTGDHAIPPVESPRRLVAALPADAATVRFFAGADHGMRAGGRLAPGYLETMAAWVAGLPARPGPPVAGAAPRQEYLSATVPPPWYGGLPAHLVALVLVLAGYLAAPLTRLAAPLARRWRRRPAPAPAGTWASHRSKGEHWDAHAPEAAGGVPAGRGRRAGVWASHRSKDEHWDAHSAGVRVRRLRWLTAAGVLTMVMMNAALGTAIALAAVDAASAAPATALWYAARAVAAGTVVLLVVTAAGVLSARRGGWRPRGAARARTYGVLTATSVIALTAAYWLA
jgi:dienelactone hydrolase